MDKALRILNLTFLVLAIILLLQCIANAKDKYTCVFKATDVGTITGTGPTPEDAWSAAAIECALHRAQNYVLEHNKLDHEAATTIIDLCANLKCEK